MSSAVGRNQSRHCVLVQLSRDTIKRIQFDSSDNSVLFVLQDNIERECGLPSDTYRLKCGLHWLTDDNCKSVLKYGDTTRAYVQLVLDEQWQSLYDATTSETDASSILRVCYRNHNISLHEQSCEILNSSETCNTIEKSDIYRLFVVLCVMSRLTHPNIIIMKHLAHIGGRDLLSQRTPHGRSLINMCRLSDQLLYNELIQQLIKNEPKTKPRSHQLHQSAKNCHTFYRQNTTLHLYPSSKQLSPMCTSRQDTDETPRAKSQGSEVKEKGSGQKVKVKTISTRAQSAQYYRSSFHTIYDNDPTDATLPAPRPPTAGPRHRPWKTWLNDQQTQIKELTSPDSKAYEDWLKLKRRVEYHNRQEVLKSLETRQLEDDDEKIEQEIAARKQFLHRYLEQQNKRLLGSQMMIDSQLGGTNKNHNQSASHISVLSTRQVNRGGVVNQVGVTRTDPSTRSLRPADNRRVGIFEIGFHGDDDVTIVPPVAAVCASSVRGQGQEYTVWKTKKKQFESSSPSNRDEHVLEITKSSDLDSIRKKLLLEGSTYEEWIGYKDMARCITRLQSAK